MKDAEYYAENTSEFEELTDTQKEAVFDGETIEAGDISNADDVVTDEGIASPDEEAAEEVKEKVSDTPVTESDDKDALEPKLLAKDGEHTIPYSELVEAREKAEQWEALSNQQKTLIEELQLAKTQDEETGGTEAQEALLDEYEGDYPEIAEELKPLIQKMIEDGVKKGVDAMEQQVNEKVAPIQETAQETANQRRTDAILEAHPDAFEVYKSAGLKSWIETQPSFVQEQYNSILLESTAEQMNELFSAYKEATNFGVEKPEADPVVPSATDKAKDIIAKTEKKVPSSLTDIPASQAVTVDEPEAMLEMSAAQLEQKFANKSPEQINEIMSKLV